MGFLHLGNFFINQNKLMKLPMNFCTTHVTAFTNKFSAHCSTLFSTLIVAGLLLFATGCQSPMVPASQDSIDRAAETITAEAILNHVEILASDSLEGRAPATPGEEMTVDYIITQLKDKGVEPGMPDGSYIQEFPLLGQRVDGSKASMQIKNGGRVAGDLEYSAEFMAWPSNEEERVTLEDAELVYVGYGIQAPEYDWDDYKGVDVSGKVLVFKNSDPAYDDELFEGDARLYYGRWSYKFEKAAEMGALGALIIHTTPTAGYPWLVVSNSWGRERFTLKGSVDPTTAPAFNGWLTQRSSIALFEEAGYTLKEVLDAADSPDFAPMPLNGITLDVDLTSSYSNMSSTNVVGKIGGNDRALKDEYVIFSSHHDHLGITYPVEGDSINNGAIDNASGVAAMLELAGAMTEIEEGLRRTTLFMFVGAEEMGLLGSLYWSRNPSVHPGKVSANFNMDSMQPYGETSDFVLIGYRRNSLTEAFQKHAEAAGRTIIPDQAPEQGLFYRSDHFSYARVGIPAIFPNAGSDYLNKPEGFAEETARVTASNYHAVSDEINEYWDTSGAAADAQLIFRTAIDVINRDEMMEWVDGDEFKAVREAMLEDAK